MFKDKPKDSKKPVYYYVKVLGAGKNKPEQMQLIPATGETPMEDVYGQLQKSGGI